MDFPRDPPNLKSLTSLFFGKKQKKQPMQDPPPPPLEPGLKNLTTPAPDHNRSLSCKKPNILSFSSTTSPSSSSSSSSSSLSSLSSPTSPSPSTSSLMDYVKNHGEEKEAVVPCNAANANGDGNNHNERKEEEEEEEKKEDEENKPTVAPQMHSFYRRRRASQEEREFPPPIPHLARTGNLLCHMPWVLKRSYIDSGRLVIQEVKVKHHEYFRAHRANGRLILQIMQLDESSTSLPLRPASPNDSAEIAEAEEDSPSSSSSSSSSSSPSPSSSPPSSPSAADECINVEINAAEERSDVPPLSSPSSLPPPPSMLSKELKNILDVNPGCSSSQGSSSSMDRDVIGTRDVMEMGTLPSILSSSMPESSFGIGGGSGGGGGGGGCCVNKRSLFPTPIPTIRPVHS